MSLILQCTFVLLYGGVSSNWPVHHGLHYGQDCEPKDHMDTESLDKVTQSSGYQDQFGAGFPLVLVDDDEWTSEMELIYVQSLLDDPKRCSIIETLDCEMKPNENNDELNFHHHHSPPPVTKLPTNETLLEAKLLVAEKLEPRQADVGQRQNILEFDRLPELNPEWRCVCNPAMSIHHVVIVRHPSYSHPYFNDTCLHKVGIPCKFKSPADHYEGATFKSEYTCVPNANCIELGRESINSSATVNATSEVDEIQDLLQEIVGYRLNFGGIRPVYQNYMLRHLTHICVCAPGYKPNGNGLCVTWIGSDFEGRAIAKGRGSRTWANVSVSVIFVLILIAFSQ